MNSKNGWFQSLGLQGGGRWRVPEFTPKTPGPVASADKINQRDLLLFRKRPEASDSCQRYSANWTGDNMTYNTHTMLVGNYVTGSALRLLLSWFRP